MELVKRLNWQLRINRTLTFGLQTSRRLHQSRYGTEVANAALRTFRHEGRIADLRCARKLNWQLEESGLPDRQRKQ